MEKTSVHPPTKRYVTDTQCLLWYLAEDRRLPRSARPVFRAAEEGRAQIIVPSIVLVEAIFLLQRQRIPDAIVTQLLALSEQKDANFYVAPLTMAIIKAVAEFGPAAIPDLPDRIIAATARVFDIPLITTDHVIAESELVRILT